MTTTTLSISPAAYHATVEKFEKINARASKRGLAGRIEIVKHGEEQTSVCDHEGACEAWTPHHYETHYIVSVEGTAPKYNGWTFVARVDSVGDTFTLATVPGLDVSRDGIVAGKCDHCGQDRNRKTSYVVRNEAGETKQVGTSCIKDFIGWAGHISWLEGNNTSIAEGGFHVTPEYETLDILAVAHFIIKENGFKPSSFGPQSTRDHVATIISPNWRAAKEVEEARRVRTAMTDADRDAAQKVLDYILSDDFNGSSTYVENLKVVAAQRFITGRHFGLIASAPSAYARFLGEQKKAEVKKDSEWIGQEGDKKVTTTGLVTKVVNCGSYSYSGPDSYLYVWLTDNGEIVKTFSTSSTFADVEEGDTITVTGTIKKHEEYKGEKVTVMTRSKVIA